MEGTRQAMTGVETEVVRETAVPLLKWTASKLKSGLLGRRDRRLVSQALQELLSPNPNLPRVEDLLDKVNGKPDGLACVRHHLEAAKEARRRAAKYRVAGFGRQAKKVAKAKKIKKAK